MRALNPHCIQQHPSVRKCERGSNTTAVQSYFQSSALQSAHRLTFRSHRFCSGCQSENRGWKDGYSPFTEMEDNTPSLKVREARANKSGKLNAEDCVTAWLISHNPTPKSFHAATPWQPKKAACFTTPAAPLGADGTQEGLCGYWCFPSQAMERGAAEKRGCAPRGAGVLPSTSKPAGTSQRGIKVVSNLKYRLVLAGNDATQHTGFPFWKTGKGP